MKFSGRDRQLMLDKVTRQIVQASNRFKYLNALRNGMVAAIPIIMIGSFAILLFYLPIRPYQTIIQHAFNGLIGVFLQTLITCTMDFLALYLLITISHSYEKLLNLQPQGILPLLCLCAYITFSTDYQQGFSFVIFNKTRLLDCIIIIYLATRMYLIITGRKYFRVSLYSDGADTVFNASMSAILPIAFITGLFALLKLMLWKIAGITDINTFSMDFLSRFFIGENRSLFSLLKFVFLVHSFWFVGIHGSNLLENIAQTLFESGISETVSQRGPEIITKSFIDAFVLIGGCGTTLSLVIALFVIDKRRNIRNLATLATSQILFNINEIIVYGLPIVLNVIMLIPFIVVPLVVTLNSYLVFHLGLVPPPVHNIQWTTPVLLSGYAATGSIRGALLQCMNLALGTIFYTPFILINKKHYHESVRQDIEQLIQIVKTAETDGVPPNLKALTGSVGSVYRMLTAELKSDLKNGYPELYYQPQVSYDGEVIGFEALLRWDIPDYGQIYPPLTIAIAEEANIMADLGDFITEKACTDMEQFRQLSPEKLCISINYSAAQISDPHLKDRVEKILSRHSSDDRNIHLGIEITEQSFLASSELVRVQLESLKKLGIYIKLDDFGMGHSSLLYLQKNHFDEIKLDGSLVRELHINPRCSNIIESIVHLSQSLSFTVLAEFVDSDEQKEILHKLGCNCYQGYYYSPALPLKEAIAYYRARTSNNTEADRVLSPASS